MVEEYSQQTGGRSLAEARDIISKGRPPEAEKLALIDFDGTIYPFGYLFDYGAQPKKNAVNILNRIAKRGYRIEIFTSRLSPTWLASVGQTAEQHIEFMSAVLTRDGIPFHGFTAEKKPCEFYIDDRAIAFRNDWMKAWFDIESLVN